MITLVKQRGSDDCGVAALATLLSDRVGYEDVYAAAIAVDRERRTGTSLLSRQVVAVAKRLGLELAPARAYDLDCDTGVLRLYDRLTPPRGHFVAVRYGLLWDPEDGYAAPWRMYRARHRARFGTLLRA